MKAGSGGSDDSFSVSDEALNRATGRAREEWFQLLDSWGAREREHRPIAAWLVAAHGVDHWWAQTLTVDYERARGLRPKGGRRDGSFDANASKTVAVPVEDLFAAVVDPGRRGRWLPEETLTERTSQPGRSARFDWGDGSTRVNFHFTSKGAAKSQVSLQHRRLPDGDRAEEMRAFWKDRLAALKGLLEEGLGESES